jgi:hypothetical protein
MIDQSGFKMACNSQGDRARTQIFRRSAFGTLSASSVIKCLIELAQKQNENLPG